MKRLLLAAALALLLAGCRRTNDAHCDKDYAFIVAGLPVTTEEAVAFIQEVHWADGTVGAYLAACLKEGWRP